MTTCGGLNREHSADHAFHSQSFQLQDNCIYWDQHTSANKKKLLHFITLILRGKQTICSRTLNVARRKKYNITVVMSYDQHDYMIPSQLGWKSWTKHFPALDNMNRWTLEFEIIPRPEIDGSKRRTKSYYGQISQWMRTVRMGRNSTGIQSISEP